MPRPAPIPLRPADVTPAWLTAALRSGRIEAAVEAIEIQPLASLTATHHRIALRYIERSSSLPASLIWWRSAVDPHARAACGHFRGSAYEREVSFYRDLARHVDCRVRRCHLATFDPDTDEHVLLLEDLAPTHLAGASATGFSVEQARACLRELAGLHAGRWGKPAPRGDDSLQANHGYFLECLAASSGYLGGIVGRESLRALGRLVDRSPAWTAYLNTRPLALIHADVRLGIVMLPRDAGHRVALVDWQGWREGSPARDVGRCLILGLSTAERRGVERELVDSYSAALQWVGAAALDAQRANPLP